VHGEIAPFRDIALLKDELNPIVVLPFPFRLFLALLAQLLP
jgi:hypothetical protein